MTADLLERLSAVVGDVDGIGVLAQAFGEHRGRDGLVLDQQDSHQRGAHRTPTISSPVVKCAAAFDRRCIPAGGVAPSLEHFRYSQ